MSSVKLLSGYCLVICLIFITGCTNDDGVSEHVVEASNSALSPFDQLPDNEAGNIVRKAIENAGEWNSWVDKKTLSFTKTTQYFDSTGNMKRELVQLHQYQLQPQIKMRITWQDKGDEYIILNNGQQAWKIKNGQLLTEDSDINSAWNSSFGSQYVMCMPYKLTDPGVVLKYDGLDTLVNGKIVHAIKTTYEKGAGSSAGFHTWWYYFNKNDYSLAANFLDFGNGFDYTQYEAFSENDGIKLNSERHSYHTDRDRDIKYLTSIYKSDNIQFNIKLEDSMFEPMN